MMQAKRRRRGGAAAGSDQEAVMGLMDVLNGMQNGPHGRPAPGTGTTSSGGMSPIMMAILGLLAYKAIKSFSGGQPSAPAPGAGRPAFPQRGNINVGLPGGGGLGGQLGGGTPGGTPGGGLGDLLKGGLGGLLAGGAAGTILGGGLNDLVKQLHQNGLGDAASSWIGSGPNKAIGPNDLANALGADQINSLMSHSGLSRDELLEGLSQNLPQVVDQLTPDGRVPQEISI
jgi:uncharacterized protein YidB (DUF937 family)